MIKKWERERENIGHMTYSPKIDTLTIWSRKFTKMLFTWDKSVHDHTHTNSACAPVPVHDLARQSSTTACPSSGAVSKSRAGLSVVMSFTVSVEVNNTEPCFGTGYSLSLICQPTSEDMKLNFIINNNLFGGGTTHYDGTARNGPLLFLATECQ